MSRDEEDGECVEELLLPSDNGQKFKGARGRFIKPVLIAILAALSIAIPIVYFTCEIDLSRLSSFYRCFIRW